MNICLCVNSKLYVPNIFGKNRKLHTGVQERSMVHMLQLSHLPKARELQQVGCTGVLTTRLVLEETIKVSQQEHH